MSLLCEAPLRQLILFPGYSLERQAQLTFPIILPTLLGGPIILLSTTKAQRNRVLETVSVTHVTCLTCSCMLQILPFLLNFMT